MSPEARFRRDLAKAMFFHWQLTWHEDREVNPGVPDLSFVMKSGDYETGWLELKACMITGTKPKTNFHIEPSQHTWMRGHAGIIPANFLIQINDETCHLVHGLKHQELAAPLTTDQLEALSMASFPSSAIRRTLQALLQGLTRRTRGQEVPRVQGPTSVSTR